MKRKISGWAIFWIIFGIIILYSIFSKSDESDYSNLQEDQNMNINTSVQLELKSLDQFSNVQELHFAHMPITYQIKNNEAYCNQIQINHMVLGLSVVENLTEGKIQFKEVSDNADINIECISPLIQEKKIENLTEEATICKNVSFNSTITTINWYTSGILNRDTQLFVSARTLERDKNHTLYKLCYADISENTTLGQEKEKASLIIPDSEVKGEAMPDIREGIIFGGKINLYQEGEGFSRCSFPAKEIHELFHIFGFDHTKEPYFDPYYGYIVNNAYDSQLLKDIMRPHIDCSQLKEINLKYLSCLKKIYSNNNFINESCYGVNFISG